MFCMFHFPRVATHRQAEHTGGLTSTVPVRQQVLWCGEKSVLISISSANPVVFLLK